MEKQLGEIMASWKKIIVAVERRKEERRDEKRDEKRDHGVRGANSQVAALIVAVERRKDGK